MATSNLGRYQNVNVNVSPLVEKISADLPG